MALGKQIRVLRDKKGLTLEQLSELSGVEVGTISALENRDSKRSQYFAALARALGTSVDALEGGGEAGKSSVNEPAARYFVSAEDRVKYVIEGIHTLLQLAGLPINTMGDRKALRAHLLGTEHYYPEKWVRKAVIERGGTSRKELAHMAPPDVAETLIKMLQHWHEPENNKFLLL